MKSVHSFFTLFCFAVTCTALGQTHAPKYVSMASNTNGYYEYLPEGYNPSGSATYPLILYMTGIGEFGHGNAADLPKVLKHGITKLIEAGTFPKSFTVNGQTHRFIIITPQFKSNDRPTAADMNDVLDYIVDHYKVNLSRIYITGYSYGAGLCFAYTGASATYAKRIAAILPIATPDPKGNVDSTIKARSRVIAANDVPVWATHNERDPTESSTITKTYINYINQPPAPTPPAKMTIYNASGHDAWVKTYNPDRILDSANGLNAYQWMLQYPGGTVPNKPPQAAAGSDQTITLPTSTVTLNGTSSTDPDGSILSYNWTKVSGPTTGTITLPNAATTTVTGLTQGVYVFRLTVTDNKGGTDNDEVTITVQAAPNVAPVANAGPDKTITLPTNSASLDGSGTDSDGTITAYSWTKVSGPTGGTITTPNAENTTVTGLTQGSYTFRLTVTDNDGATDTDDVSITVSAAPNQPPVAAAGADQTITLPANSVTLSGTGTDSDGTIASYHWTKASGPAGASIATPNSATTTVTGLVEGSYVFQLTVTDNEGATAADEVTITVKPEANKAPVVNAGADQNITLPTNSVNLNGTATDSDGTISTITWTKTEGPSAGSVTNPAAAKTTVTGMTAGTYVFRLVATDNAGASDTDYVKITVNAAANKTPAANAGVDVTITLPINQASLSGSGTDEDGMIVSYSWTKISGPAGGTITTPTTKNTTITGLVEGSYVFRLTVTDNDGAAGFDEVQITVQAAPNVAPVANAGADQTITLPANSITLNGSGTDSDGSISSYAWAKVSGPAATITNLSAAITTVTGLAAGTYLFRLTVTDNEGKTGTDDVTITVNAAPNKAPVANAGANQSITLPTNSVSLSGSGTDTDGQISSYAWTKTAGPSGGAITNPDAAATTVTGLTQGSYTFRLTVTDNDGATDTDDVSITVSAAPNQPPVAAAGADQTITLPANSVTLSGTGTDNDGTIASYHWTKVSGPAGASIVTPNSATTTVTGLVEGSYVFQLTVTDNEGATAADEVTITVNAAPNQAPTANAGTDKRITLPTSTAILSGSGTDADGTISSYAWTKVSGPDGGTLATPDAATTTVNALQQGNYVFLLTVTDDKGATGSDSVLIEVTVVTSTGGDPAVVAFKMAATPNPAVNYFRLEITSPSMKPIYLRLTDAMGRVMEERTNVQPGKPVLLGYSWKPGVYVAEAVQNGKKVVVKLLKQQ